MSDGKRVLMLTSQFLPEVFGGAEQQCLRLSRALAELGHAPHILTSRSEPGTPADEVLDGIPVTRLHTPAPPQIGGRKLGSTLRFARDVSAWIDAQRPGFDLIHCHQAKLNAWIGVREATRRGLPSLVKPGSAGPNFDFFSLEKKRFVYGRMAAGYVKRHADMVVAISQEMLQDVVSYGIPEQRRAFIPNGVPIPGWSDAERAATRARIRTELGLHEADRMVLFVGRMERQKNVDTLLRAFARAEGAAHLVLLGDGVQMEEQKRLAAELGLSGRAHFRGRVDTVTDHLAAADIFVLPAIAEGMSNALLEAMAAGTLPVVSEVSGNTDLVRDGENGILYQGPRDADALAAALTRALGAAPETAAALAARARQDMIDTYSIAAIARRYDTLYGTLCKEAA